VITDRTRRWRWRGLAAAVGLLAGVLGTATAALAAAPLLTRYPYLTDMTPTGVTVNFATDTQSPHPVVQYGLATDSCTRSTAAVTAHKMTVGTLSEYQYTAVLTGLGPATRYCYRLQQSGGDLLGTDPSPTFTTFPTPGTAASFSFAVFGDWGSVDDTGANPDLANVMARVAGSGASFLVTTGDNAYPGGSQTSYGDLQQTGAGTSAVFGPLFWKQVGKSIPAFLPMGNHGMSSGSSYLVDWPQSATVAASGGRYQLDTYCCAEGSASTSAPSVWYAFTYGQARFYVLQAAWGNSNVGTGSIYSVDFDYHWSPSSPELQWLQSDLAANAGTPLKFAFLHFPFYSDSRTETSDPFLQGASSLEGLLASSGVQVAFSGHTHFYERNVPVTGSLTSYVTGGGGAPAEPVDTCGAYDAYAIGWSYSRNRGSGCRATPPASVDHVFHFLLVSVSGTTVTVTPTDELGRTFDTRVYQP